MDYSSNCSSDGLNVYTSNNLIDVFDDTECMDVDASISEAQDCFERDVAGFANVSSLIDSESDHGEDVASLSSLLTSETQDGFEENEVELASNSDIESLNDEAQVVLEVEDDDLASVSELLASSISSGSVEIIDIEDGDEDMVDGDQVSNSHSQLSVIQDFHENIKSPTVSISSSDSSTQAVLDDHFENGELRRNREESLQSAPVPALSTDSSIPLTPLEEHNFRINIDQIRLGELRREAAEMEALLDEQESTVDQCTGYGILQGNLDFIRDIEGVLPKLPSFQLTFNWLTNSENNFNLFI